MERVKTVATVGAIGVVGTVGSVGRVGSQEEETEEPTSSRDGKSLLSFESSFEPTLDSERERTFEYLKEHRRQKRLKQKLEHRDEASEETTVALDRVFQKDMERSQTTSGGAMAKNTGVNASTRRTPADGIHDHIYVTDETGGISGINGSEFLEPTRS